MLDTKLAAPPGVAVETVFSNTGLGAPYLVTFFCSAVGTFFRIKGETGGETIPTNVMVSVEGITFTPTTEQALVTEVECAPGEWTGEASAAAACAAVGLPAGPGVPPSGGEFASRESGPSITDVSVPAMEIKNP